MNREELIERIQAVRNDGYLSATYLGNEHVGDLMGDILDAFEQAHTPTEAHEKPFDTSPEPVKNGGDSLHVTPTDDEREALIDVMVMTKLSDYAATDMSTIHQAVDAILAAGFRRTAQAEPTDAQVLAALNAMTGRNPGEHLRDYADTSVSNMRAALRAAAEAK